jgi:hypothetical protein
VGVQKLGRFRFSGKNSDIDSMLFSFTRIAYLCVILGVSFPFIILLVNNLYRNGLIPDFLVSIFADIADLGVVGDWFGGSAAPLLNLATFILLYISIRYQKEEIQRTSEEINNTREDVREQRNLIMQQQFETTFFNLINILATVTKNAEKVFTLSEDTTLFEYLVENGKTIYRNHSGRYTGDQDNEDAYLRQLHAVIKMSIYDPSNKYRGELDSYVRGLKNVLREINDLDSALKKDRYSRILESQLSGHNVAWLFYYRFFSQDFELLNLLEGSSLLKRSSFEDLLFDRIHLYMLNDKQIVDKFWIFSRPSIPEIFAPELPPIISPEEFKPGQKLENIHELSVVKYYRKTVDVFSKDGFVTKGRSQVAKSAER